MSRTGWKAVERKHRRRRWLRRVGYVLAIVCVLAVAALIDAWSAMGTRASGERIARVEQSPQYQDGGFANRLETTMAGPTEMIWPWIAGDEVRRPDAPIPIVARHGSDFASAPNSGLRLTWLGHSTFLIEIDGMRILTDPVWGERASPLTLIGPSRFHPPPLSLSELPPIDAVIISHDHYDHLDYPTIVALRETETVFMVPLGVGAHLEYWGVPLDRVVELDWWQDSTVGEVSLVSTPARHFSGRGLTDRDATLWTSWAIVGPKHRVYFSGDTAMSPDFATIGNRYGPFDVTLIEAGAYDQLWRDVHLGPEQAVQAHIDLKGKLLIPIHWGTFNLAIHAWTEPAERLIVAAAKQGASIAVPRPGQSVDPGDPPKVERWWPEVAWKNAEQAPAVSSHLEPRTE